MALLMRFSPDSGLSFMKVKAPHDKDKLSEQN